MATVAAPKVRKLAVVAQDPGVLAADGTIVTGELTIPYEELDPGPAGHRVHVVDYDATHKALLAPATVGDGVRPDDRAILAKAEPKTLRYRLLHVAVRPSTCERRCRTI
jgi:hypothetical protein